MAQAERLGWGAGWPNCPTDRIVVVRCGANGVRLPMRQELAPLVAGLVADLEAARAREGRGPFNPAWCWGFACRSIAGTNIPSNHSQGTSPDLDAPENPHASAEVHAAPHSLRRWFPSQGRYLRTTMPLNTADIARRWGFAWGGLYPTKPDPMHFDPAVTPAQAARLIAELRAFDGRPVPPEQIPQEDDDMQQSIVFYDDGAGGNHAYLVTNNIGKYLGPSPKPLQLAEGFLKIPRANDPGKPLGVDWQELVVLVDGPLKNTGSAT